MIGCSLLLALGGVRDDCGAKLGYLKANVEYALQHPELAEDFRDYLKERATTLGDAPICE